MFKHSLIHILSPPHPFMHQILQKHAHTLHKLYICIITKTNDKLPHVHLKHSHKNTSRSLYPVKLVFVNRNIQVQTCMCIYALTHAHTSIQEWEQVPSCSNNQIQKIWTFTKNLLRSQNMEMKSLFSRNSRGEKHFIWIWSTDSLIFLFIHFFYCERNTILSAILSVMLQNDNCVLFYQEKAAEVDMNKVIDDVLTNVRLNFMSKDKQINFLQEGMKIADDIEDLMEKTEKIKQVCLLWWVLECANTSQVIQGS